MARFYGEIGFAETVEGAPDVFQSNIIRRNYYGSIERNTVKSRNSESVNDDIDVYNVIGIIADPYLQNNAQRIRYVSFMGSKWKVTSIEVQYPRLLLTLGGVWNGADGPRSVAEASPAIS